MDKGIDTVLILLLIPLFLVEIGLMAFAINDLIKRKRVKWNNKWLWVAIILLIDLIGPIIYFVVGREEE